MSMVKQPASSLGFTQWELPRDELVAISKLVVSAKPKDGADGLREIEVSISTLLNSKWLMPRGSDNT